jgi:hypothetical protein
MEANSTNVGFDSSVEKGREVASEFIVFEKGRTWRV